MLETSEERIRLLKAGITGKDIEKLYVIYNNFKIIGAPLLFNLIRAETDESGSSVDYGVPEKFYKGCCP
ncbi:MAG: hypothetical protein OIN66_04765 [Candidatus Methanoperedens sp.]|nr:hypothetical protein [Candidatus Methanoperedens sp.]